MMCKYRRNHKSLLSGLSGYPKPAATQIRPLAMGKKQKTKNKKTQTVGRTDGRTEGQRANGWTDGRTKYHPVVTFYKITKKILAGFCLAYTV